MVGKGFQSLVLFLLIFAGTQAAHASADFYSPAYSCTQLLNPSLKAHSSKYELFSLDPGFRGEENGIWHEYNDHLARVETRYLNAAERKEFEITISKGALFDSQGRPLKVNTYYIFVMAADGKIFASNGQHPGRFHHSSFLAGAPVAAAGEFILDEGNDGKIEINGESGHYLPTERGIYQFLLQLKEAPFPLNRITYHGEPGHHALIRIANFLR